MNTEESRNEFEKWFKKDFHYEKSGPYVKNMLLEAWQAAKAHAVPQWIPVSERLPEYGANVLIVVDGETEAENQVFEFKSGKWSSGGFFESNKDDGRYYYVREVKYWMPLPAAPVKDGE